MITKESVLRIVKKQNGRVITPLEIIGILNCTSSDEALTQLEHVLQSLVQSGRVVHMPASSQMYKIKQ